MRRPRLAGVRNFRTIVRMGLGRGRDRHNRSVVASRRRMVKGRVPRIRRRAMEASDTYALGRSEAETRRLIFQHQIYGPITRRFFQAAGIGTGMKVLDLGSGAGDVAMLVAEMVGPAGEVIGVDMNAEILETARARAQAAGWTNVTLRSGDVREIALDSDFDAVVGRWVL